MSDNKRIFYACQAVAITNLGDDTVVADDMMHGVQSIGINTTFNLEQAFELGQIEIYENIEGTPDVEVTMEKVLDGYPLIYHKATQGVGAGGPVAPAQSGLAGRSAQRADVRLGIFNAESNNVAGAEDNSGNAEVEVYLSGMFVSNISYTLPVDGSATESVTLVGNNKQWLTGADVKIDNDAVAPFDGTDFPLAQTAPIAGNVASGGIQQREDVLLAGSIMPLSIDGVGTKDYGNAINGTEPIIHVQNFTCSTDFSREDILELGRKTPYFRPANFPIEVTCEIEAITISGDFVNAYEFGDPELYTTIDSGNNLSNESIFVYTRGGYGFCLGEKNKLSSVSYGGGDAGGGNVSVTYSYSNFNQLDIQDYTALGYVGFGVVTSNASVDSDGYAQAFTGFDGTSYSAFPSVLIDGI